MFRAANGRNIVKENVWWPIPSDDTVAQLLGVYIILILKPRDSVHACHGKTVYYKATLAPFLRHLHIDKPPNYRDPKFSWKILNLSIFIFFLYEMILISKYFYKGPEFVSFPSSSSSYKEIASHHSIATKSKKMNKLKNQQCFLYPQKRGDEGKPLHPGLERQTGKYRESQLNWSRGTGAETNWKSLKQKLPQELVQRGKKPKMSLTNYWEFSVYNSES